ncbi:conserved hypothetical protein, partial [Ixodes scapularis]
ETSFEVQLYIYDLSRGLAKSLTPLFLGKQIPGIWHTSIVAYGREYFFGSMGIESCGAGQTVLHDPDQILTLGHTELPYSLFLEYIFALGESSYKPQTYDLFKHNCNNFTQEVATFLTGKSIPQEILDLPEEFLNTAPHLCFPVYTMSDMHSYRQHWAFVRIPSSSPILRPGRTSVTNGKSEVSALREYIKKNERRLRRCRHNNVRQSDPKPTDSLSPEAPRPRNPAPAPRMSSESATEALPDQRASPSPDRTPRPNGGTHDSDGEAEERPAPVRKSRRYSDPPVFYSDVNVSSRRSCLEDSLGDKLNEAEQAALRELHEYLVTENGAWALGTAQLDLFGRLFTDASLPVTVRLALLRVLQAAALKEDVILFLHQDRKSHCIMSYVYRIETLSPEEQDEVLKLLCNMCSNVSSYDWLLYISEWSEEGGQSCNNARSTVRAAVHGLLTDRPVAQERSAGLMFNLALKEQLFDDTAAELSTAILQYLHGDIKEEQAFHCLTALLRFLSISYNDVPALIQMLGPDLKKFSGLSERVGKLVDEIQQKLSASPSA